MREGDKRLKASPGTDEHAAVALRIKHGQISAFGKNGPMQI
jgi:hypothetical protein